MRYLLDSWSSKIIWRPPKAPPVPPSGYGPAANFETFGKRFRFSGDGWRRLSTARINFFGWAGKTIGRGRNRCKRPRPDELGKVDTKTSRGPQHFAGPPRNETDITQNKKFRQCVFAALARKDLDRFVKRRSNSKKQ